MEGKLNLKTFIGSLELANPIITASGCFGYGLEFSDKMDISGIGAMVTKGLSLKPRAGNPMPRICETPAGMLNSIGLENVGLEAFEKEKLPELRKTGAVVIANFFGESVEEYVESARRLNGMDGVSALEMNVSCPNVDRGGIEFGSDPVFLEKLTADVRKVSEKPLIVKLSPNVADIKPFAKAVENGGADAVSAINTLLGMSVDIETGKSRLNRMTGGLSGPAIKPVALRMVYECCGAVKIPVIGIGGISCVEDVVQFLMVGAAAVQIGTFSFVDPSAPERFVNELADWCADRGVSDIGDLQNRFRG
jgi:dihydroorotate dehydrogenase (NAD+) catalytic subunit